MKIKKKTVVFAAAVAASIFGSCMLYSMQTAQSPQLMAERWQAGETSYAQISVFPFIDASDKTSDIVNEYREVIENKIKSEGFEPENEDAEIWTDAYCSSFQIVSAAVSDMEETEINITGVGGDFFEFHPLTLVNGNYIYEEELSDNRAVLDETAAWSLFCSLDVVGMKFKIFGSEFEVAGVVRREEGKSFDKAYPDLPIVYIHYNSLEKLDAKKDICCYEAVLPNPVSNYARNIFLEYYGIDSMTSDPEMLNKKIESMPVSVIENTSRYKLLTLFSNIKELEKATIVSRPVAYPYWENSARVMALWLTLLFFIIIVLYSYIIISIICFLWKLYVNRTWHLKDYIEMLVYKYTYKNKTTNNIETDVVSETEKGNPV